ncbi:hypothetical protein [Methylobacterium sp. P1-11]|uniref:hypothetical protein n=1 Tax=Methylobacterium sp. P1-11 TaxID=2024616 RepID=UPI0011F05672|nr:hypothetical protein [Methylobacterium sp. P1-11]
MSRAIKRQTRVSMASHKMRKAPPTPKVPPPAEEADIVIRKGYVYGPNNIKFGKIYKKGLVNYGITSISSFFVQDPQAFPETPQSLQRVIQAVSENEGKIEAINTYDNSFLSVGVFQWTAGAGSDAGELPGLLAEIKTLSPENYETYFGSLGIEIEVNKHSPEQLAYGYIRLNNELLDTSAKKAVLRKPIWAYRFWRAAHDKYVRRAQILHAMGRVNTFYYGDMPHYKNLKISDFITSEYGVALLLDEHVNRPGHVPGTLRKGLDKYVKLSGKADPASWSDEDETTTLAYYLEYRQKTNMTNSKGRADATKRYVKLGKLSDKRGSFDVKIEFYRELIRKFRSL